MQTWKMHLSLKKVESRHFHSRPPGKSLPQTLIIPWQWEITHPPRQHCFRKPVTTQQKGGVRSGAGRGNCDSYMQRSE